VGNNYFACLKNKKKAENKNKKMIWKDDYKWSYSGEFIQIKKSP
tara:strand:+ start:140 stop:271 length:132 start_codon:yes stop_codon:yes gene_type:complete